jgi:dihydrofolate reductase
MQGGRDVERLALEVLPGEALMRPLVVQMTVSVDGCVASLQAGLGGTFSEDELSTWKLGAVREAGIHVVGRVTYEQIAAYWPTAKSPNASWMNTIPKVVFSSTVRESPWGPVKVARGPLVEAIAELKHQPRNHLLAHGGAAFVQALSRDGLVDEYRLVVQPVAVRSGLRLFKDLPKLLRLTPSSRGASRAAAWFTSIDPFGEPHQRRGRSSGWGLAWDTAPGAIRASLAQPTVQGTTGRRSGLPARMSIRLPRPTP